jgi:hypothetical protein
MKITLALLFTTLLYCSCTKESDPAVLEPETPADTLVPFSRLFGGTLRDQFRLAVACPDGGYLLAGDTYSSDGDVTTPHGGKDIWLVKIDTAGNLRWQKTLGGSADDGITGMVAAKGGGYIVAAHTKSVDGDVKVPGDGAFRPWVFKIDEWGAIGWQRTIGPDSNAGIGSLKALRGGGYIGTGLTGTLRTKGWVFKLDEDGSEIWDKVYGEGDQELMGMEVAETADGGYIVAGETFDYFARTRPDAISMRLDKDGNLLWQKVFGGTDLDYGMSIIATSDGGSLMTVNSMSNDGDAVGNHGLLDVMLVRQNADGTVKWKKMLGGSADDGINVNTLLQTTDGHFIFGAAAGSSDGDVTGHVHGKNDGWLIKMDDTGEIMEQRLFGGSDYDDVYAIVAMGDSRFLVAGGTHSQDGDIPAAPAGDFDAWVFTLAF